MLHGPLTGPVTGSKMARNLLFSVLTVGPGEGGTERSGWEEVRGSDLSVWALCSLCGHFPGWPVDIVTFCQGDDEHPPNLGRR